MPFRDRPLPHFDVDGASPTFDLSLISLGRAILDVTGLSVPDSNLDLQLIDNFDGAADQISNTLSDYDAGMLLRVNLRKTGLGSVGIPGGEIMTLIGLGIEPIDALAEYFRGAGKNSPSVPPAGDASSFFWFTLSETSSPTYEMTDALAQEINDAGFDAEEIENVIRQLDAYVSTGDDTLVYFLLNELVSVDDGDQSLSLTGAEALTRLVDALRIVSADLKNESKVIVAADGVAIASGLIWLGAGLRSDRIVIVAINKP